MRNDKKALGTILGGVFIAIIIVMALIILMTTGIDGGDGAVSEAESTSVTAAADSGTDESAEEQTTASTATKATVTEPEKEYITYTFRTQKQYDGHYEKHGAEFGDITQEEYLKKANDLINNDSDTILHKTEAEDGDYIFYDTENNEILFLSTDGYIRTFFKPSRGIDYYNAQ